MLFIFLFYIISQYVSYIVTVLGVIFSLLFQFMVHEPDVDLPTRQVRPSLAEEENKEYLSRTRGSQAVMTLMANRTDELRRQSNVSGKISMEMERKIKSLRAAQKTWKDWLSSISFYKITLIYAFGRLLFNVSQAYSPLYLQKYLKLPKVCSTIFKFLILIQ